MTRLPRLWPSLLLVAAVAVLVAAGPFLAPADPLAPDLLATVAPPGAGHVLGTDGLGRDVLARVLCAGPRSLGLACVCVAGAAGVGVALGVLAACAGGVVEVLVMRTADGMMAFPGILLALLLSGLFSGLLGGGVLPMLVGLKLTLWPQFARMARASAAGTLLLPHVEAARLAGFPARTVLRRHVLPPVLRQVTTLATLGIGSAVMSISALGFLGLGLQPPAPEWGAMINELLPFAHEAPVQLAAPCLALFLSVLGFTLLGRALTARMASA